MDTKKKILILYDVAFPFIEGGGQRRIYEVSKRLIERGYSVDWICFKTWDDLDSHKTIDGINYIGVPGFRGLYRLDGSRRRMEPIEFLYSLLKTRINWNNYSFIWAAQWPLLHLLLFIFWPRRYPNIQVVIDWWELWGITWFKYSKSLGIFGYVVEWYLIIYLSKISKIVLISPKGYNQAISIAEKTNCYLINNGIDYTKISSFVINKEKDIDVIYLGRLKNHKRVDLLLKAIEIIDVEKLCGLINVVIIGDGPEKKSLQNLLENSKIKSKILFLGEIKENDIVYKLIASSKLFVNPSTKEGGGSITLFESFAAGVPVMAFNCSDGVDPCLLMNNKCGYLVDCVSPRALAVAISAAINNPKKLESLSRYAHEHAKVYDWNIITDEYEKLFRVD
jgi:glycosyltransferase involved in cell wall biosynthesis